MGESIDLSKEEIKNNKNIENENVKEKNIETGKIISIKDGIIKVTGLKDDVKPGELFSLENGEEGLMSSKDEDGFFNIVILGKGEGIKEDSICTRLNKFLETPVGEFTSDDEERIGVDVTENNVVEIKYEEVETTDGISPIEIENIQKNINESEEQQECNLKENQEIEKEEEQETSWKDKVSEFSNYMSNVFSSSKKEEEKENILSELSFDEEEGNVKLKDGILYAYNHMDVFKLSNFKLKVNNVLIIFPQVRIVEGKEIEEDKLILKFGRDGWFQVQSASIELKDLEIEKVKTIKG